MPGGPATRAITPPDDAKPAPRSGTQSIERTVRILRALASHGTTGWTLPDLSRHCALDRGTARRILVCLVGERLALYRASDRRYLAGPFLFELGLALPHYHDFERRATAALEHLPVGRDIARFLCFRSGHEFVCAARLFGTSQGYSVHAGARRPLGSSVAGMAMLLGLPPQEARDQFEASIAGGIAHGPNATPAAMRAVFEISLAAGIGKNEGMLSPGWHSYAVGIRDAEGTPFASIMVGAWQLPPERTESACIALQAAARELEEAMPPSLLSGA